MDNETYPTEPITKVTTEIITKFDVNILNVKLFKSCLLGVTFYTSEHKFVEYKAFELVGADYSNWANDDDYIIEYVKSKM